MHMASTFTGLFHSDPDYAPFGIDWLRGLTPARIGVVVAFCAVFTLHQSDPANLLIWDNLRFLMTQVVCYVPMLVLALLYGGLLTAVLYFITASARSTRRWTSRN